MRDLHARVTRFTPAPPLDRKLGLIGWVAIVLNDVLKIDGIAVRRTRERKIHCFYPERRDEQGRVHRVVWPLPAWARRGIEKQIIAQLYERAARRERVLAP